MSFRPIEASMQLMPIHRQEEHRPQGIVRPLPDQRAFTEQAATAKTAHLATSSKPPFHVPYQAGSITPPPTLIDPSKPPNAPRLGYNPA